MTDENICYAKGCREPGPKRCSACRLVHYCSGDCQKSDWKQGAHKSNCKRYQVITKLRHAGEARGPEGIIAITELREGRIPLAWALDHPPTTRVVTQGILDVGYKIVHRTTEQRLTHEINENELTHEARRDIVLAYFLSWLTDLTINNNAQLERTLAKSEPSCHECGKAGDLAAELDNGGLMPDRRWAFVKNLCKGCFLKTRPQMPPSKEQMDWHIVAYEPGPMPSSWIAPP